MKKLQLILTIIVLTGLIACEPSVRFTEPQPINKDNLSKFPNRLQGDYLCITDSSSLNITEKQIIKTYDFNYKIDSNQLDSTIILSGDTLIDLETNERILIKQEEDSLLIHIHNIDTLFQMNTDNVVRKYKGYYFLNTCYDKTTWSVEKVELSKGLLTISSISTKQDIDNLKEITESPQDTIVSYNFTVTKKQFKEFIKNDGFSKSEKFIRKKK